MNTMSNYFTKLESYSDLEVSIIRHTKIHKVLRMIVKLSSIPRDEDFHFKQRAMDILSKWRNVLDSDTTGLGDEKEKETKPTANGLQKEGSAETPPKADTEEEKEVEPKPEKEASQVPEEPMPDADATEKVQTREPVKEVSDEPVPKEGEATEEKAEEKPVEAAA